MKKYERPMMEVTSFEASGNIMNLLSGNTQDADDKTREYDATNKDIFN